MRGLEASARDALSRRLLPESPRPIVMALSGGGDSLALTLIADAWAREQGRELLILTVDHSLQAESAGWTEACAATARRLGRPYRTLTWEGDKPDAGLPAAARHARHALLADAAREAGARVILMGHTADDAWEARLMRGAGSTTPEPRLWAPSPAWPEGRGVFILRPLIARRRAEIRDWLHDRGETWIDDPANEDLRYARSRARAEGAPESLPAFDDRPPVTLADRVEHLPGAIRLHRPTMRRATVEDVKRLLGVACVCAGGGARLPASGRLLRAAERIRCDADVTTTLAGARIAADHRHVHVAREAGEAARGGLKSVILPVDREVVWDGRFSITARRPGLSVRRMAGVASRLGSAERHLLGMYQAGERGALPAIVDDAGQVSCPILGLPSDDVAIESLLRDRFRAAAGLVQREPA